MVFLFDTVLIAGVSTFINTDFKTENFILKIKFYQRKHFSKDFDNITEEDVKRIEERAIDFRTRVLDGKELSDCTFYERNGLYATALRYLVSPTIGQDFPTYDERMLFLIKLMDPDFIIAQTYMRTPFKTNFEISKADEEEYPTVSIRYEKYGEVRHKDIARLTPDVKVEYNEKILTLRPILHLQCKRYNYLTKL